MRKKFYIVIISLCLFHLVEFAVFALIPMNHELGIITGFLVLNLLTDFAIIYFSYRLFRVKKQAVCKTNQTRFMTELTQKVDALHKAANESNKQVLFELLETIKYSDCVSNVATAEIEQEVLACYDQLYAAVHENQDTTELVMRIKTLVYEREAYCKIGKK